MAEDIYSTNVPTQQDAVDIVKTALHEDVDSIIRFPTGSEHYVFDVITKSGNKIVVRIGRENARSIIGGAVYWHKILKPKGVPLADLLFYEVEKDHFNFPVMVLDRLPGQDLGEVYPYLTSDQKRGIVEDIVAAQHIVATLPQGKGFGYATSYDDKTLKPTWLNLIEDQLDRTKRRIDEIGIVDRDYYHLISKLLHDQTSYFSTIQPIGFLDDTTTKNVIIDNGNLSGIVDVDYVCFGDHLFVVSLTNIALLSKGYDLDYISYWTNLINLSPKQYQIMILYTMMHCVGFMSEIGHGFNKEKPKEIDYQQIHKLETIFAKLKVNYNRKYSTI